MKTRKNRHTRNKTQRRRMRGGGIAEDIKLISKFLTPIPGQYRTPDILESTGTQLPEVTKYLKENFAISEVEFKRLRELAGKFDDKTTDAQTFLGILERIKQARIGTGSSQYGQYLPINTAIRFQTSLEKLLGIVKSEPQTPLPGSIPTSSQSIPSVSLGDRASAVPQSSTSRSVSIPKVLQNSRFAKTLATATIPSTYVQPVRKANEDWYPSLQSLHEIARDYAKGNNPVQTSAINNAFSTADSAARRDEAANRPEEAKQVLLNSISQLTDGKLSQWFTKLQALKDVPSQFRDQAKEDMNQLLPGKLKTNQKLDNILKLHTANLPNKEFTANLAPELPQLPERTLDTNRKYVAPALEPVVLAQPFTSPSQTTSTALPARKELKRTGQQSVIESLQQPTSDFTRTQRSRIEKPIQTLPSVSQQVPALNLQSTPAPILQPQFRSSSPLPNYIAAEQPSLLNQLDVPQIPQTRTAGILSSATQQVPSLERTIPELQQVLSQKPRTTGTQLSELGTIPQTNPEMMLQTICEQKYPKLYSILSSGIWDGEDIVKLLDSNSKKLPDFFTDIGFDKKTKTVMGHPLKEVYRSCHPDKDKKLDDPKLTGIFQILQALNRYKGKVAPRLQLTFKEALREINSETYKALGSPTKQEKPIQKLVKESEEDIPTFEVGDFVVSKEKYDNVYVFGKVTSVSDQTVGIELFPPFQDQGGEFQISDLLNSYIKMGYFRKGDIVRSKRTVQIPNRETEYYSYGYISGDYNQEAGTFPIRFGVEGDEDGNIDIITLSTHYTTLNNPLRRGDKLRSVLPIETGKFIVFTITGDYNPEDGTIQANMGGETQTVPAVWLLQNCIVVSSVQENVFKKGDKVLVKKPIKLTEKQRKIGVLACDAPFHATVAKDPAKNDDFIAIKCDSGDEYMEHIDGLSLLQDDRSLAPRTQLPLTAPQNAIPPLNVQPRPVQGRINKEQPIRSVSPLSTQITDPCYGQLSLANHTIESLTAKSKTCEDELARLKGEIDDQRREHKSELDSFNTKLATKQARIQELEKEKADVESQLGQIRDRESGLRDILVSSGIQLGEFDNNIKELERDKNKLEGQVELLRKRESIANDEIDRYVEELKQKQTDLDSANEQRKNLQKQYDEKSAELNAVTDKIDELSSKLTNTITLITTTNDDILSLLRQIFAAVNSGVTSITYGISEINQLVTTTRQDISNARQGFTQDITGLQQELTRTTLGSRDSILQSINELKTFNQRELASLNRGLDAANREKAQLIELLTAETSAKAAAQSQLQAKQEDLLRQEREFQQQLASARQAADSAVTAAREQYENALRTNTEQAKQEANRAIAQSRIALENERRQLEIASTKAQTFEIQNDMLKQDLDALKSQSNSLQELKDALLSNQTQELQRQTEQLRTAFQNSFNSINQSLNAERMRVEESLKRVETNLDESQKEAASRELQAAQAAQAALAQQKQQADQLIATEQQLRQAQQANNQAEIQRLTDLYNTFISQFPDIVKQSEERLAELHKASRDSIEYGILFISEQLNNLPKPYAPAPPPPQAPLPQIIGRTPAGSVSPNQNITIQWNSNGTTGPWLLRVAYSNTNPDFQEITAEGDIQYTVKRSGQITGEIYTIV